MTATMSRASTEAAMFRMEPPEIKTMEEKFKEALANGRFPVSMTRELLRAGNTFFMYNEKREEVREISEELAFQIFANIISDVEYCVRHNDKESLCLA